MLFSDSGHGALLPNPTQELTAVRSEWRKSEAAALRAHPNHPHGCNLFQHMIRILLADDHRMFLDGISALLKDVNEFELIGRAEHGGEVMAALRTDEPDVLVMDINMPGLDGLETLTMMREKHPGVKVLVLSMHSELRFIQQAIEDGATGYILKNADKDELCEAIRTVAKGEKYFSRQVSNVLIDAMRNPEKQRGYRQVDLSQRELEVLALIAQECTTPEIAERLFISEHTVKSHRKNLISKLGVKNIAGLVRFAIENDLLDE